MKKYPEYTLAYQLSRGDVIESVHHAAGAVVDPNGNVLAWFGDPEVVTYLRSSAKPFQALPFVEQGGPDAFYFSEKEVALMCASHAGMDMHAETAASIQQKAHFHESDLQCGVHPPTDPATAKALEARGEAPTPNRHNCSGKHSGMLSYAQLNGWNLEGYLDNTHPVQEHILASTAEMVGLAPGEIFIGIDGCSAPNFAMPLRNAAQGFARLCDPAGLPEKRAAACWRITHAMTTYPEMIAGPGRFDTRLMEVTGGRMVSKGGAEGYQAIGLMPGALLSHPFGPGPSPALGIAVKIADGGARPKALSGIVMELLRQLNALSAEEMAAMEEFGPTFPIYNWRKLLVGKARPCFELIWSQPAAAQASSVHSRQGS